MKNNRGQLYGLFMVFIVLIMMGAVLGFFYAESKVVDSAVVSPMKVLIARDNYKIFENKEMELIQKSLDVASGEFGSEEFHDSFRVDFISRIYSDEFCRGYLFENLTIGEVEIEDSDKNFNLFEDGIYPRDFSQMKSNEFVFSRGNVGKKYYLENEEGNEISFPVRFNFEMSAKYIITLEDGEYKIERFED